MTIIQEVGHNVLVMIMTIILVIGILIFLGYVIYKFIILHIDWKSLIVDIIKGLLTV